MFYYFKGLLALISNALENYSRDFKETISRGRTLRPIPCRRAMQQKLRDLLATLEASIHQPDENVPNPILREMKRAQRELERDMQL